MAELATMAMLSALHVSVYSGRKFDKKATAEVAQWHKTDEKVGRYSKRLLPEDAHSFKLIGTKAAAARAIFNRNTLPWYDDGSRMLPSANFLPCTAEMRAAESEFLAAIPPFIQEWPMLKARAKVELNGLWREEDYPSVEKLKKLFKMELKFFPIPDGNDFRAQIRDEDLEAIKKQIDLDTKETLNESMKEPYRRLFDGVAHMASRLNGAKTCPCRKCKGKEFKSDDFNDSLVNNLVDMCEVLPRLNLTGDDDLEFLIEQVKANLTEFKPDMIRGSEVLRKTLAQRAAEIQESMKGFY